MIALLTIFKGEKVQKSETCKFHTYIIASKMVQCSNPVRHFWECHVCGDKKWMTMNTFKKYCQENYRQYE